MGKQRDTSSLAGCGRLLTVRDQVVHGKQLLAVHPMGDGSQPRLGSQRREGLNGVFVATFCVNGFSGTQVKFLIPKVNAGISNRH